MLPSRMLPHVWGEESLQTFIDATAQHEPDLAHCAEFKREILAATKEALLAAQKPGPAAKISPLRLLPLRISNRRRTEHSHLTVAELSDKTTGKVEPVLLEDKSYASGPRPQYEKFVETRVCDCVGYVPNRQDKSYSFVFRFPGEAANDADPISLQKLLPSGPSGWYKRHQGGTNSPAPVDKPCLRTRFTMAQSLSQSLALLQARGVLHKGIAPANILFFQGQGAANTKGFDRDLSRPFISGFTWGRLHGSEYISDHTLSKDFASSSGLLQAHPAYSFNPD